MYYGYFVRYIKHASKKEDDYPLQSIRDFFPRWIQEEVWLDLKIKQ